MVATGRCVVVLVAAALALSAAGVAAAAAPARPPIASAPSEYVEVVPTAGGGAPVGAGPRGKTAAGPGSALGAAADAVGGADRAGTFALVAAMLATAGVLVAAALRRGRRQVPNG